MNRKCDCGGDYGWKLAVNEDGWFCGQCGSRPGEPEGFCPQLDILLISKKVESILFFLSGELHAEPGVIYVSNGSMGDAIVRIVSQECKAEGRYDQNTITRLILDQDSSHAVYWAIVSDGVRSGKDPRVRCKCGELATMLAGDGSFCSSHWPRGIELAES